MILNKENTFTEQNRFLVYSDQLNATRKQILDTAEEMISRSAIQTFEDEGESVTATDASYLASLTVDGKAVQDGTPTPDAPVSVQVVQGVNLLTGNTESNTINASGNFYPTTTLDLPAGTYTFSFETDVASGAWQFLYRADTTSSWTNAGTKQFSSDKSVTFEASTPIYQAYAFSNQAGTFEKMQLESGNVKHDYAPHGSIGLKVGSTITPIDLQGNVLASLPDGTKDVLTVDSVGHVVMEKRTKTVKWSEVLSALGLSTSSFGISGTRFYMGVSNVFSTSNISNDSSYLLSNCFAATSRNQITSSNNACAYAVSGIGYVNVVNSSWSSAAAANSWFDSNKDSITFVGPTTPTTIDLGYIDLPAIPDGSQISITAQVTPTIAAKWWTKNQSDVAAAFSAVSSDLATLQGEISALDARVTALESASAKSLVIEKLETEKQVEETEPQPEESDYQEEMNLDEE